jgi:hypothetical protein
MIAHHESHGRLPMTRNRRYIVSRTTLLHAIVAVSLVTAGVPAAVAEAPRPAAPAALLESSPELKEHLDAYPSPLFVPAADFRTDGLYPEANFYSTGGYWTGDDLGGVYMMAPVWLPDGADISTVWLLAVDDDSTCSSDDITMWLQRVDNYTGAVDSMAVMSTSGASPSMQTPHESNPTHPVIDYPGFAYWLTVRICSTDHELYGAMIIFD